MVGAGGPGATGGMCGTVLLSPHPQAAHANVKTAIREVIVMIDLNCCISRFLFGTRAKQTRAFMRTSHRGEQAPNAPAMGGARARIVVVRSRKRPSIPALRTQARRNTAEDW
jgi:hypothetical protein